MSPEHNGNNHPPISSYDPYHNGFIPGVSLVVSMMPQTIFRFRYASEMHGTHGSLIGQDSTREHKTFPTVQVMGVEKLHQNNPTIRIRCTLYQTKEPQPHSHKLVIKNGDYEKYDPHFVDATVQNGYSVEFKGMGIIHTAKKEIITELGQKLIRLKEFELERELTPFEQEKEKAKIKELNVKSMNLNQVRLCFEAFCYDPYQSRWFNICAPVFSNPINNMKSALTGELRIGSFSCSVSSVSGEQLVYLLVEKVNKGDIKIRFFDDSGWQDFARIDTVHHQYAIVMRTPPYKDQNITEPVHVWFQLYRPSDEAVSMPREFTYKPKDVDNYSAGHKRKVRRVEELVIPTVIEPIGSSIYSDDDIFSGIDLESFNLDAPLSPEDRQKILVIQEELIKSSSKQAMDDSSNTIEYDSVSTRSNEQDSKITETLHLLHNLLVQSIKIADDKSFANVMTLVRNHDLSKKLLKIRYGNKGLTLLHLCIHYGRIASLKELIDSNTDLNVLDNDGNSPLHACIYANQTDCLKVLLDHKRQLDMELKNYQGLSALHVSVRSGSLIMTKMLAEYGASLNAFESQTLDSTLHVAVQQKNLDMVKFILKNTGTVLINHLNGLSKTPLDLLYDSAEVFDEVQKEIAKCLLDQGAWSHDINENESEQNEDNDVIERPCTPTDETDTLTASFQAISMEKTPENPIKFDDLAIDQLRTILNSTDSWRQCATLLDLENLCDLWGRQDDPSECLLAYIEGCKYDLQSIIDAFQSLDLKDAISVIDGMVARQLS